MNIIWGVCVIAFSVLAVFKYRPKQLDSLAMSAMSIATGIISIFGTPSSEILIGIISFALQMTVVVCCVIQLRSEFKLRNTNSDPKVIKVTKESRATNRKSELLNNLPTVTA